MWVARSDTPPAATHPSLTRPVTTPSLRGGVFCRWQSSAIARSEPVDCRALRARNDVLGVGGCGVSGSLRHANGCYTPVTYLVPSQPRHCEEAFFTDAAIQRHCTLGSCGLPRPSGLAMMEPWELLRLAQPRHCEEALFADAAIQCHRTLGARGLLRRLKRSSQ